MSEVEVFIGVVVKNQDGTENRYQETGTLKQAMAPVKVVAKVGMITLKKILDRMREGTS